MTPAFREAPEDSQRAGGWGVPVKPTGLGLWPTGLPLPFLGLLHRRPDSPLVSVPASPLPSFLLSLLPVLSDGPSESAAFQASPSLPLSRSPSDRSTNPVFLQCPSVPISSSLSLIIGGTVPLDSSWSTGLLHPPRAVRASSLPFRICLFSGLPFVCSLSAASSVRLSRTSRPVPVSRSDPFPFHLLACPPSPAPPRVPSPGKSAPLRSGSRPSLVRTQGPREPPPFFLAPALALPLPGPRPTRPCCGPSGLRSPGRPGCERGRPGRPQKLLCKEAGGGGPHGASSGCAGKKPSGTAPRPPAPPAPAAPHLGRGLTWEPAAPRQPPARAQGQQHAQVPAQGRRAHAQCGPRWACGRAGVRGAGTRPTGRSRRRCSLLTAPPQLGLLSSPAGPADELTARAHWPVASGGRGVAHGRPMGAGRRPARGRAGAGVVGGPFLGAGGRWGVGAWPACSLGCGRGVSARLGLLRGCALPCPRRPGPCRRARRPSRPGGSLGGGDPASRGSREVARHPCAVKRASAQSRLACAAVRWTFPEHLLGAERRRGSSERTGRGNLVKIA